MERIPTHGIEVFLTIVREGSMRAAADALGVGAPAVTLQLKSLEDRLGVDLLFRTTRTVELTEAGKVLFDAAAPAHRDLTYAIKKTKEMARSTTETLRLSLSRGAYIAALAPALPAFLSKHPGINGGSQKMDKTSASTLLRG
jgi:DNA-binding transcriptional LysR family regulator